MDSTEIVKKRLVDLKKLSKELKDSTHKDDSPDFNIIKAIIDITKDSSPTRNGGSSLKMNLSQFLLDEAGITDSPQSPKMKKN